MLILKNSFVATDGQRDSTGENVSYSHMPGRNREGVGVRARTGYNKMEPNSLTTGALTRDSGFEVLALKALRASCLGFDWNLGSVVANG